MKDIYTESIILVPRTTMDRLKPILFLLLTIASFILYVVKGILMVIPLILFGYLLYKNPFGSQRIYEYIHVNDSLDIDLVTQTRKHLCTVDLNHVVLIAPVSSSSVSGYQHLKAIDYSNGSSDSLYILIYNKDGQKKKLLLSLEQKMQNSLRQRIPMVFSA